MNSMLMLCDAATPAATQPAGGGMSMMIPMLLILAIFYFMMIRPQQRKEKERRKMIEELRAGAKIVFAGGLGRGRSRIAEHHVHFLCSFLVSKSSV